MAYKIGLIAFFISTSLFAKLPGSIARPKAVYGNDDRYESMSYFDPSFQELGASVAMQVGDFSWEYSEDRSEVIFKSKDTFGGSHSCPNEPFGDQIAPGRCSGFLIAPDIMLTAGHCVESESICKRTSWVFDYYEGQTAVKANNLYHCKEIVSQSAFSDSSTVADYAIIRLERATNRKPLTLRKSGEIALGTPVVLIGHPSGLPQKIADNAFATDTEAKDYFLTNLDAFTGNSGSPVFNRETKEVEGILVQGREDYNTERGCFARTIYEDSTAEAGEKAMRITSIPLP